MENRHRTTERRNRPVYLLERNIGDLSPVEMWERVSRGASHLLMLIMFEAQSKLGDIRTRASITKKEAAAIAIPAQGWSRRIFEACFRELISAGFLRFESKIAEPHRSA